MRKNKLISALLLLAAFILLLSSACRKLIEVNPPTTSANEKNVFTNDATAAAVLTDVYAEMSAKNIDIREEGITSISLYSSLSADELMLLFANSNNLSSYYKNDLTNESYPSFWNTIYPIIGVANGAIEGLTNAESLTSAVKEQLLGEAKFIRAFCYFYLVNLYGDVPLVLTTNYKVNALLARAPQAHMYEQIIKDLTESLGLLNEQYLKADVVSTYPSGSEERVRPTKAAANALLARVYLFTNNWAQAETAASGVINKIGLYDTVALKDVFLKNSRETIWALQPIGGGEDRNTGEGKIFNLTSAPFTTDNPVQLDTVLLNSFEAHDKRRENWVGIINEGGETYYYPNKYKVGRANTETVEYIMVLRLAEQYLIRAEARVQQGNVAGALEDLNIIRNRAGLPKLTGNSQETVLNAILHERRIELFTEWGHRWLDLKRAKTIDAIMAVAAQRKGSNWQTTDQLYPLPQTEIDKDRNLIQNPGYN